MSLKGMLRDIQYYSMHDGPGIRTTVFLKGCPLRCAWCANVDTQSHGFEISVDPQLCSRDCVLCHENCIPWALSKDRDGHVVIDREVCTTCAVCPSFCPTGALKLIGQEKTVDEVLNLVKRDKVFYDTSGGGVTISGGEPLAQPEFLLALLKALKSEGIHTVLDTSGFGPSDVFESAISVADMVYYDLKLIDPAEHLEWIGVSNELIISNFRKLGTQNTRFKVRFPVIPGINDSEQNLELMASLINEVCAKKEVDLLPYHRLGSKKHSLLGKTNLMEHLGVEPPSKELMQNVVSFFSIRSINAKLIV